MGSIDQRPSGPSADPRAAARHACLARVFGAVPPIEALPADASPRRYFRLAGTGRLLMEVPPGAPDFIAFLAIARHLSALGLSAPTIIDADPETGHAVIEDFGDRTFTRLLAAGSDEAALYRLATETLAALHAAQGATDIAVPSYDFGPLDDELGMFTDWFVPAVAPGLDQAAFKADFLGLWHAALSECAGRRDVLVLRDFHVDNLMVIDGRDGIAACGLLDFQDALIGSAAYDLMSLAQDARRDLSPGLEEAILAHYLALRPDVAPAAFMAEYWLLAAHRHTKVAGNFERLSRRDGKHGYLVHLPRVLRLLERALEKAGLDDIRRLMDRALPGWQHHAPEPPQDGRISRDPQSADSSQTSQTSQTRMSHHV